MTEHKYTKTYRDMTNAQQRLILAAPNKIMRDRWVSTIAKLIGKKLPTLPNYGNLSKNSARKPVENQIRNLTE